MPDCSIEAAREVKVKAREALDDLATIAGIGITRQGGGYAVKVNFRERPSKPVPSEIDGVPIVYEVVGVVTLRPASAE